MPEELRESEPLPFWNPTSQILIRRYSNFTKSEQYNFISQLQEYDFMDWYLMIRQCLGSIAPISIILITGGKKYHFLSGR